MVIAPVTVVGVGCAAVTIGVLVTSVMVKSYEKKKKLINCDSSSSEKWQATTAGAEHNLRPRFFKNVNKGWEVK